jgi:putative protein-disulfide isomerase
MSGAGHPRRFRSRQAMTQPTPRLLAFLDCMCSWCYGFSPVMEAIRGHFGNRLEYMLFTGGLRPFNAEPMAPAMREKLSATYQRIGEITGQPFVTTRLMDAAFIYNTEPASRAIVALRHLKPGEDYSYYLTIQRAFYARGEDITREEVLARYATEFELDEATFLDAFRSEAIKQATLGDFEVAKRFGIDGFPTLLLHRMDAKNPNALIMVGHGYASAADSVARIEEGLAMAV